MLYLLKSAVTNEYLQENLHILAASDGAEVTIGYAARWVDPELWGQVGGGAKACLVFGDRPYQWFVPVRQAEVVGVVDEAGELTVTVQLGPFARGMNLEAFSQRFAELNRRRFFVVRDPKPELAFISEGEDNLGDWKRIVEALQSSPDDDYTSRYARSVFLRYMPLCNAYGQPFPPGGQLEVGQLYQQPIYCYAPGLEPKELHNYRLVVEPSSYNVEVNDVPPLPSDGELTVEIKPLEHGDLSLEVWVKPDRTQSTALHFTYQVIEALAPVEVIEVVPTEVPAGLNDRHLRAIFDVIQETDSSIRDQALLDLIKHVLEPLAQESHYLKEQRAMCLYKLERWADAYEQFEDLDPDLLNPQAVVAWFVSACRGEIDANFEPILSRFTAWDDTRLVEELITVLPEVIAEDKLLTLMEVICYSTTTYQRRVWDAARSRFTQPATILAAVDKMVCSDEIDLLSESEGYAYLVERMTSLELDRLDLLERAVDLGLKAQESVDGLDERFLTLLERRLARGDDLTDLWSWAEGNRGRLGTHTWAHVIEVLAEEMLAQQGDAGWEAQACHLYIDLASFYRKRQGDLETAAEFLSRASNVLPSGDAALMAAWEHEQSEWVDAVQCFESVRQWWKALTEVKQKHLRQLLSGRRAVFIGGPKRGFNVETVRTELALAEAEFVPHFHSERGRLDKVRQRIKQGQVDYVIDFIHLGAHRNLEDDCRQAGVTYVPVPRSRSLDQIVRALARMHDIKLDG